MVVTKRSFSNCTLKLVLNQRYIPFEGDIWQWKRFLFFREFWTTYRNWNYKTLWDKTNEDDILQSRALLWNSHLWRQSYDLKIRHNTLNCPILSIYVFHQKFVKPEKDWSNFFSIVCSLLTKSSKSFEWMFQGGRSCAKARRVFAEKFGLGWTF